MQLRIITIPFSSRLGGFDDEPLRAFITDKQVHSVESWHFVHESTPYWSFCVNYTLPDEAPSGVVSRKTGKTDKENWRKQLGEPDWPVFNALREWRKERADKEGVPPYLVFTNEQLTRMILDKIESLSALGRIPQVGPSRVEKYGKDVLRILNERTSDTGKQHSGAARADSVDGVSVVVDADDGKVSEESTSNTDKPN